MWKDIPWGMCEAVLAVEVGWCRKLSIGHCVDGVLTGPWC